MNIVMNRIHSIQIYRLIYFILLSFIVRFPFSFRDVIHWDESTFILMGQSLLDGHLPYTELWDVKPPLLFASFALFILFLGKNVVAIRIAGIICVAFTAWFTHLIGNTVGNRSIGIISGTLFILAASYIDWEAHATSSFNVALVPMMAAIAILVALKLTLKRLFWTGILIGVATMIRTNLAYVALSIGIASVLISQPREQSLSNLIRTTFNRGLLYAAGVVSVIITTMMPYIMTGQISLWWQSVVIAPLNYTKSKASVTQAFYAHIETILGYIFKHKPVFTLGMFSSQVVINALIWLGGIVGITIIAIYWRQTDGWKQRGIILVLISFLSVSWSILKGGSAYSGYLEQILPFMAIFASFSCEALLTKFRRWQIVFITFSIILCGLVLMPTLQEYKLIGSRVMNGIDIKHGPSYEIAKYLKSVNPENKPVYLMTSHLVYWLINEEPLTRSSTHPSNISKEYLLKTTIGPGAKVEMALAEVLEKQPEFIVTKQNIWYLRRHELAQEMLENVLNNDYKLVKEIQGRMIYKRSNNSERS